MRGLAIVAAVIALGGCGLSFLLGTVRNEAAVSPADLDLLRRSPVVVAEVRAERGLEDRRIRTDAEYIVRLLLSRRKAPGDAPAEAGPLYLRVHVKEETFVRDFESLNAVGIRVEVHDGPDLAAARLVYRGFYAEETSSTIASPAYLFSALQAAMGFLF